MGELDIDFSSTIKPLGAFASLKTMIEKIAITIKSVQKASSRRKYGNSPSDPRKQPPRYQSCRRNP